MPILINDVADLNAANAARWAQWSAQAEAFGSTKQGQRFFKSLTLKTKTSGRLSRAEAFEHLRNERSIECQLIELRESGGAISDKKLFAHETRRKAKNGMAPWQIVKEVGLRPENLHLSAKELRPLFFEELKRLGLNPTVSDAGFTYDGMREQRFTISDHCFQNIVSNVCPRRKLNKSS